MDSRVGPRRQRARTSPGWGRLVDPGDPWDADDPMKYGMVGAEPGGIGGGIAQAQDKKPRVTFYVEVANLEESLKKAKKLGGKTMMEPSDVPGGPRIAMFKDPEGNAIGLVQAGSR